MTIISTLAWEGSASTPDLKKMMHKPLIVGASVSADWATKSPGKLLALRFTDESHIQTIAFGGKSGRDILKNVSEETLQDRTIVIGLDLFFWDATLRTSAESLGELDRLMHAVEKRQIPIILGEVPLLLPGMQPQAAAINQALHAACLHYEQCTVVPFTSMLFKILRDGSLTYKGSSYGLRELIPDGLHIGPIASRYIADSIYEKLQSGAR